MDKKIQLTFNNTVNKRVKVRTNCELYSHDKNNNEFELTIGNHTLTNEEAIILFKFVKSIKYWETQGRIEDNKIKFKFDTSLITDNERVNCYIILKNENKESDVYSFSFDVKMSEYDLKDNLPVKERYFANSVVVDKLDVLTKEVLAEELEKAKGTYALKTEIPSSETIVNKAVEEVEKKGYLTEHQSLNGYVTETQLNEKGYLTQHQDISKLATKEAVDDVAAKVTALETRPVTSSYDDSEIKRKLKELEDRPTTANIDTSNFVTTTQLEDKHYLTEHQSLNGYVTETQLNEKGYLTQHQDISKLATKEQLDELRNSQPTVNTSDLVTKEQLRKAFLDEEEHEKYAKRTELPQPYNDTDIKSRLTTLENRPASNVDTNEFVTKKDYLEDLSARVTTTAFNDYKKSSISNYTLGLSVDSYFRQFRSTSDENDYGKIYNNTTERKVYAGKDKFADLDMILYTVATALPEGYGRDYFTFGESDKVKLITNKNISNYLPANTGNGGNTTELDKRLKVLEANTGNTTELDKRLKAIETNPANTTELDKRLKVLEAKQWEIHGRGMPNGTVTAPVGTTYVDEAVTNGALKWIKKSGTGNVGWDVLIGDTGWKVLPSVSKLGGSYVKVRRVNNVVSYQFGGLSWGWFGIVRRGGAGYQIQPSDRERNCFILGLNGVPTGYRSESSLIGGIYNDKGTPYGTWYLGGTGDGNMLRFQFTDPVPTDRDIGDIRISSISYLTSDLWPQN